MSKQPLFRDKKPHEKPEKIPVGWQVRYFAMRDLQVTEIGVPDSVTQKAKTYYHLGNCYKTLEEAKGRADCWNIPPLTTWQAEVFPLYNRPVKDYGEVRRIEEE